MAKSPKKTLEYTTQDIEAGSEAKDIMLRLPYKTLTEEERRADLRDFMTPDSVKEKRKRDEANKEAAEANKEALAQAADRRRKENERRRSIRKMADPTTAAFSGAAEDVRLQQGATTAPKLPIDAKLDKDGNIITTGLADNTVVKSGDRYFRYDVEIDGTTEVFFNPNTDSFVAEDYSTPEGLRLIKSRMLSGAETLRKNAIASGDPDALAQSREIQEEIDAINMSTLRDEERDRAFAELYKKHKSVFQAADDAQVKSVQEAQAAAKAEQEAKFAEARDKFGLDLEQAVADLRDRQNVEVEETRKASSPETQQQRDVADYQTYSDQYDAYMKDVKEKLRMMPEYRTEKERTDAERNIQKQAALDAGLISRVEAGRSPIIGPKMTFEDYQHMRNTRRGMRDRASRAKISAEHAMQLAMEELRLLDEGPLSEERYYDFLDSMMEADLDRSPGLRRRAENLYLQMTNDLQMRRHRLNQVVVDMRGKIARIDFMDQYAGGGGEFELKISDVMATTQRLQSAGYPVTFKDVREAMAKAAAEANNEAIYAARLEAKKARAKKTEFIDPNNPGN